MHLLGIWNPDERQPKPDAPISFGGLSVYVSPHATVCENEGAVVAYQGRIFDKSSEELLGNTNAIDRAYGIYSYVKMARRASEITIGSDRMGFGPLYYALENDTLLFATSLVLLKDRLRKTTIDYEAWEEILNLERILGEKTTVKEIKRLGAGQKIVLKDGRITFETVWTPEEPTYTDPASYVEQNNRLLHEALDLTKNDQGSKIILLSGGDDSRRLVLAARECGLDFGLASQIKTGPGDRDEDSVIAQKVAEGLGKPIQIGPAATPSEYLEEIQSRNYWLGFEAPLHEWIAPLLRKMPQGSLVYDGALGGVLINSHPYREHAAYLDCFEDLDAVTDLVCPRNIRFEFPGHLTDSSIKERVRAQFEALPRSPHGLSFYYLMTRTRRIIASWHQLLYLNGLWPCVPFLYYPLFLQSLSLPPDVQRNSHFQHECMRLIDPVIADLPSTRRYVPDEMILDLGDLHRARQRKLAKSARIRQDVYDLFPHLKRRSQIQTWSTKAGLRKRFWIAEKLHSVSLFMDWLEQKDPIVFPVGSSGNSIQGSHWPPAR